MKKLVALLGACLIALPAFAAKDCEELKAEIAAKLDAKGVKNYQLEIVPVDAVKDQKVVGSCDGGKKKITYKRG
ncbi:MAG TPA: DUF1161 domain-containing protein [Rhodocyclaceae bacterium]|nr:DUF1161 domain-containing protein [Rhodocyclaceae bacterium]